MQSSSEVILTGYMAYYKIIQKAISMNGLRQEVKNQINAYQSLFTGK
jgi:hypothetical protein